MSNNESTWPDVGWKDGLDVALAAAVAIEACKDIPIKALEAGAVKGMRDALTHIAGYWNGARTDEAMSNALEEIVETALNALSNMNGTPTTVINHNPERTQE